MSKALLRSVLELRTPLTRLPPTYLLPIRARCFNSTTQIVEPISPENDPIVQTLLSQQQPKPSRQATRTSDDPFSSLPQTARVPPRAPSEPIAAGPIPEDVRALLPHLAAQPGHYIRIHIHGFPYLVTPGDQVRLPVRIPGVLPGDVLRLNRASVLGSRDFTLRGGVRAEKARNGVEYLDERLFECRAVVLGTESEPLRTTTFKQQRNRRKRTFASKHQYTVLRISELKISDVAEFES